MIRIDKGLFFVFSVDKVTSKQGYEEQGSPGNLLGKFSLVDDAFGFSYAAFDAAGFYQAHIDTES